MKFEAFNKIPRVAKTFWCTITEKIDGSNAQVVWTPFEHSDCEDPATLGVYEDLTLRVGSRNRWIGPGKDSDNYGFARWCIENADELRKLGPGQHFGEWYGSGIQCGYGLTGGDKRFALFNARRWGAAYEARKAGHENDFPSCVEVVPWLYSGVFSQEAIDYNMKQLRESGSFAVPGFMSPEGIIVEMNGQLAKHTFMHSDGKWLSAA
ncbi:RNA ligase family protein